MNNNLENSHFDYNEDLDSKETQRRERHNFYNSEDLFEYYDDFNSQEFTNEYLTPSNANSQKINEAIRRRQRLGKSTKEIVSAKQVENTIDVVCITKTLTKVWNTTKTNINTQDINPKNQDLYVKNTREIELNEKIINSLTENAKTSFEKLNKKYKMCIAKLEEVINYFRTTDSDGFKWSEDKLRSVNEENIVKIKYEFKNWVNENQNNLEEKMLNKKMVDYSKRLDIEYSELDNILSELKKFLKTKKITSEKEVEIKPKLSKNQKVWFISLLIILFLSVIIVVVLLLLFLVFKI
ncbi:hypothetical protein ACJA28_00400 [Mesomycoplasma moatsii]|uniref:hypothetical protein n=1 Tax=Mesomycoplasma moatsii TaxID=171287 RepID=UPI0003B794F6